MGQLFTEVSLKRLSTTASQVGNSMFKVNNRNTTTRCEICSNLTIKTPERLQWGRSGVFIVNLEHISLLVLVFLLLTLNMLLPAGSSQCNVNIGC